MGHLSGASSNQTIDPNDRYSVFRAVSQPDVSNIAASPSVESNERFGVFQSSEQPAVNAQLQSGRVPLFQAGFGWNKKEDGNTNEHFPKVI